MRHRGPDDAGTFISGSLGLGHRRLSIIDLGGGHQPMTTTDGRFTVVFNGEIYNYRELRRDLESDGCRFLTRSDTEVILHLHARLGDSAVTRLNGMFAYAIWDGRSRRLLLVRDRAGIKPLYYAATEAGVAFASEIKALFESGVVRPSLDAERVGEYLTFRQIAGTACLFDGVSSLLPGHTLQILDGNAAEPRPYWALGAVRPDFPGSLHDAVDELDHVLGAAVKRQLIADVPLGTFCSGGIDSSLVTAMASRQSLAPINTYSVAFDDANFDESEFAQLAALESGSIHHELRVNEAEYVEALPDMVWHHDLPLNFANSVHIHAVSRLARANVKVVLTGEGADELFGGYPRYYIPRLLGLLSSAPLLLRQRIGAFLRNFRDHRLRKLGSFAELSEADLMVFNSATAESQIVDGLLRLPATARYAYRRESAEAALAASADLVTAMSRLDFETYLVSILDRQDKMSMATSIEARVPFLDNAVIELALSLPLNYRQTLRHRKRVLRNLALRYLPARIVNRPKSGFGVPISTWFAGQGPLARLLGEALQSETLADLVDQDSLAHLAMEHSSRKADHSDVLWAIVNLHLWRLVFRV